VAIDPLKVDMYAGMGFLVAALINPEMPRIIRETEDAIRGVLRQYNEGQEQISAWENEGGSCAL
jgi:hypothetical protein